MSETIVKSLFTILAAVISGVCLLRTTQMEYVQKKQRAHWFFDEYLYACGKAIANYANNKEEYYATYMRYLIYADVEIKIHMNKLDSLLKKDDTAAKIKEVNALVAIYNEKYKTEQYQLYKRKNKKWVRF